MSVAVRPRLGFLGVGWIGRHRLEALEESGAAEVAAVADPAVEGALGSLDELLAEDLDGLVIATPSALHAEQAIAALEAGLPVFCQKPLSRTAEEARAVVEAARRADRLLAVDLCYRHLDAVARMREQEIGEVFAADLVFHNAYGPDKPWFYDPELSGGGCAIDLGTHLVDLALWFLGFPRVTGVDARLHGEPVEDYAVVRLDLDTGAVVRIACSWNLHAGRDAQIEAVFHGTEGSVVLENVGGSFFDFRAELRRGTEAEELARPPDEWGGRAAIAWAERLAVGEAGFDPECERLVTLAETIDEVYGR